MLSKPHYKPSRFASPRLVQRSKTAKTHHCSATRVLKHRSRHGTILHMYRFENICETNDTDIKESTA